MKALAVALLALLMLCACVDADDTTATVYEDSPADYLDERNNLAAYKGVPDNSRTVSYLSEREWDGWEESPERVRVRVDAGGDRHIHYFESMPVAYGWLEDRYEAFDIVELMVANALTGRDLLDARSAHFAYRPGYGDSLPVAFAYPTRTHAVTLVERYPERYFLRTWPQVDRTMVSWRDRYWDDWRDDFGFTRTATVAHYDGEYWDGWYDLPDRVLVRVDNSGDLRTHYFDGLPVAWSWLDNSYDDYEIIDLQVAGVDLPGRLLNAREATYLWMPDEDALPAVLAFATRDEARRYLSALGGSGFRLLDWDDLTPRLASWSDEHWNEWRGNPERNRGIARALESGLGRKLGLRDRDGGVVAGDRRERERLSDDGRKKDKEGKAKSHAGDDRRPAKARNDHDRKRGNKAKSRGHGNEKRKGGSKAKSLGSGSERKARGRDSDRKGGNKAKGGGGDGGKDRKAKGRGGDRDKGVRSKERGSRDGKGNGRGGKGKSGNGGKGKGGKG